MRSVLKRELLGNIDKVWCQRVPQNKQIIHYWYSVMLNHDWPSFWLVLPYILSLSHYRYFWCKGKYYIEIHSKLARQCRRYECKYAAAKVAVTYTSAGHFDHKPPLFQHLRKPPFLRHQCLLSDAWQKLLELRLQVQWGSWTGFAACRYPRQECHESW